MVPLTFTATAKPMGLVTRPRYEIDKRWPTFVQLLNNKSDYTVINCRACRNCLFCFTGRIFCCIVVILTGSFASRDLIQRRARHKYRNKQPLGCQEMIITWFNRLSSLESIFQREQMGDAT